MARQGPGSWQLRVETGRLLEGQRYTRLFAYAPVNAPDTITSGAWYSLVYTGEHNNPSPQEFANALVSLASAIRLEPNGYQRGDE